MGTWHRGAFDTARIPARFWIGGYCSNKGFRATWPYDTIVAMLEGTARLHETEPWAKNPGGSRTIDQALALVHGDGILIPRDVRFLVSDDLVPEWAHACYGFAQPWLKYVEWSMLYTRAGFIPVRVRSSVLESDEAIIAVFAHELFELDALRSLFDQCGGRMPVERYRDLLRFDGASPGNLHDQAVSEGDWRVIRMRKSR